jgi:hypothetical protein
VELDPLASVFVKDHAIARAVERLGGRWTYRRVRGEVRVGILEGRWGRELPLFIGERRVRERLAYDGCVFVWDAAETRVWIVRPSRDGRRLEVRTVFVPTSDPDGGARPRAGLVRVVAR